nr:glycoside hydrolase family 3 N-terminal domain-containing protein [Flexivirga meconopsidis]
MTPAQRVGQLLMIGIDGNAPQTAIDGYISGNNVGNVIYLGGWTGISKVASTSNHLQDQATSAATGGVPLLIAADQEGGAVQQLKGQGFTRLVSAREQGAMPAAQRKSYAATIGTQLRSAGVNVNLAPVADTVPSSIGTANQPIGRYGREYGNDPGVVGAAVADVVQGLGEAKVAATVKHFPGIGRITGNTDITSTGISDDAMTASDPYLQAFSAGIKAGAELVMVSSARYPKLDSANQAPFSAAIINGLLRGKLGWQGVVVTDDMNAVAVAGIPPGERAVRFVAAGGDIVLTGRPSDAAAMISALTSRAGSDKGFAQQLQAAEKRVLALKERQGLLRC